MRKPSLKVMFWVCVILLICFFALPPLANQIFFSQYKDIPNSRIVVAKPIADNIEVEQASAGYNNGYIKYKFKNEPMILKITCLNADGQIVGVGYSDILNKTISKDEKAVVGKTIYTPFYAQNARYLHISQIDKLPEDNFINFVDDTYNNTQKVLKEANEVKGKIFTDKTNVVKATIENVKN